MDVADSTVNAFSGHDWSTAVNDDFLSFSDDVSKRAALFVDDTGPADDGRVGESIHVAGEVEQDRESMVSPTTAASVEHMVHGNDAWASEQTSADVTNTDGVRVNFQNAFQSAFNLVAPEQPKQIWRLAFGNIFLEMRMTVWISMSGARRPNGQCLPCGEWNNLAMDLHRIQVANVSLNSVALTWRWSRSDLMCPGRSSVKLICREGLTCGWQ